MNAPTFEPGKLRLSDFNYDLPESRIAKFPLEQRDQSNLLVYRKGQIEHRKFYSIAEELPPGSLMVCNDTKVIRARLHFFRKTGAHIEIFLLHPHQPAEIHQAMESTTGGVWQCMVGNKKKWKHPEVLELSLTDQGKSFQVQASWQDREQNLIQFTWDREDLSFAELISRMGELPLPPYLNRKATKKDLDQYQTVYATHQGAVAAPTAGLHLTPEVLQQIDSQGIGIEYLTLHVGAGTFQPVKQEEVWDHEMHSEQMRVSQANLERLIAHEGSIIPVGTTSMRVLESLYWLGVKVMQEPVLLETSAPLFLEQTFAYDRQDTDLPDPKAALQALLQGMKTNDRAYLLADTQIYIMPGYQFRICSGLITNFHLPATTLLLLIAALVGDDWKRIYQEALDRDYRFLSYGDSSLLLPA